MNAANHQQARTDHYLQGNMLGNSTVFPVKALSTYLTDHRRDINNNRLARYRRNWNYYTKQDSLTETGSGRRRFQGNMVAPVVDKSTDWLFNQGWNITCPPGNEPITKILDHVWKRNNKNLLCWHLGQMGGVTGDGFLFTSVDNFDQVTGKTRPREESQITIKVLNSSYVFPEFDPASTPGNNIIKSAVIQYPIVVDKPMMPEGANFQMGSLAIYTMYIDDYYVWEFVDDLEIAPRRKNILGFVPLSHVQNLPLALSYFGMSDVDQIYDTNDHLNDVSDTMKKVVEVNGEPMTVGFGFKAEALVRGVDKMISGLPADARIESLALDGNQAGSKEMHEIIRKQIHINSSTPEQAFGEVQSLGNVTQVALKIQYMPLWEKTKRKYLTYGSGIATTNRHILRIAETFTGVNLKEDYGIEDEVNRYETIVEFNSPFPQDEKEQIELFEAKKRNGLISNAEGIRQQNYNNPERIEEEIVADRMADAMQAVENAQANAGQIANLYAFGMDSIGINTNAAEKFEDATLAFIESQKIVIEHRETLQQLNEQRQMENSVEQERMDMERAQKEEAEKESMKKSEG